VGRRAEVKQLQATFDGVLSGEGALVMGPVFTTLDDKIEDALGNRLAMFNANTFTEGLLAKFPCPDRTFSPDDGSLTDLFG